MGSPERAARDEQLRDAVLRGDERAWKLWYDEAFEPLWAYVQWRTGGNRAVAEEIIQETWLMAVRRIRAFDPRRGSFDNWLCGIAANLIRNHLRRERTARQHLQPLGHEPVSSENPDEPAAAQSERIMHALAALPERSEAVLKAKYLDGQSVNAIAAAWNETPKAIESLLSRRAKHSGSRIKKGTFWFYEKSRMSPFPRCAMNDEEFDPLAEMLGGKENSPSDAVRDAAFAPTRNVLRRRRVMRRARVVVALVGCYLAGVASVGWRQTPTEPKQKVIASLEEDLAIIAASGVETRMPKTKFERLRAEADRTWNETRDMDAALRLYARAIRFATPAELEISPDQDNFILTTLKEARLRETHYAFADDNS